VRGKGETECEEREVRERQSGRREGETKSWRRGRDIDTEVRGERQRERIEKRGRE